MRCSSFGIDFLAGQQANGGTTIVTVTDLTATDVDNTNGQLVNTVTGTLHGAVLLGGIATASFTEADLVANAVSFQHDGSATNGRFTVSLTDGTAAPQTATVIAAVDLPGNNPPVLAGDLGIAVANGSTVIATATDLTATDSDNTNAQLVYTVTGASHGTVLLGGIAATSFTQADLVANAVSFQHDGSATNGSFTVSLTDGTATPQSTTITAAIDVTEVLRPASGIHGDLGGDHRADLVIRDAAGTITLWQMNGGQVQSSQTIGAIGTEWHIDGIADFNWDGKADVLLHNDTGAVSTWQMDKGQIQSSQTIGILGSEWSIDGSGDFNGDGKSDVLLRSDDGTISTWQMDGTHIATQQTIRVVGADQHLIGSGDFNGDHNSDILWRADDGVISTWQMKGSQIQSQQIIGVIGTEWHLNGTGDFNGDGKADILLSNDAGIISTWQMDGAHIQSQQTIGILGPEWHFDGTGDFDADGKADILLRRDDGTISTWQMDGTHIAAQYTVGPLAMDSSLEVQHYDFV
jgi:hypothetical protein